MLPHASTNRVRIPIPRTTSEVVHRPVRPMWVWGLLSMNLLFCSPARAVDNKVSVQLLFFLPNRDVDGNRVYDGAPLVILNDGPFDIETTTPNQIEFDSAHSSKGFAVGSRGWHLSGIVTLGSGGELVSGPKVLTLTDFECYFPDGGSRGEVWIGFTHRFDRKRAALVKAKDGILGSHTWSTGQMMATQIVRFQGFMNHTAITSPTGKFESKAGLTGPAYSALIDGGHGPMTIAAPAGAQMLNGGLEIILSNPGDWIRLPNSAEVGIVEEEPYPVSLPTVTQSGMIVLCLVLLVGFTVMFARRRPVDAAT